ncbi:MAG TPA: metallophosphoesterase [Clostridia bacterium]
MNVYAVSDLHLSINNPKPMDIFGGAWENYLDVLIQNWKAKITNDDLVLISGDISWAMTLNEALPDLEFIHALPGKKILIRGNHDYWWNSISALRKALPPSIIAIQNDCVKIENYVICGTRGWTVPENNQFPTEQDRKIYLREIERLKLTLNAMTKARAQDDKVILMMHFPPFNSQLGHSDYTHLITQFNVDCVVYGHLHGKGGRISHKVVLDNIPYYLTSCDKLNNDPLLIY